ncbi:MAG: hypothetical protein H0U52_09625 [Chloroflexi bacterium]|nr:hypothetical protein [Chloroflexota bacterium]
MDLSTLVAWLAIGTLGLFIGRHVIGALSRSSDVMASLFVPPDRTIGWPIGVQESDEPWGWRDPDPDRAIPTSAVAPGAVGAGSSSRPH